MPFYLTRLNPFWHFSDLELTDSRQYVSFDHFFSSSRLVIFSLEQDLSPIYRKMFPPFPLLYLK